MIRKWLPCWSVSNGQAWFRLWSTGPGLCVRTRRRWLFSDRMGLAGLRIGGLTFERLRGYVDGPEMRKP